MKKKQSLLFLLHKLLYNNIPLRFIPCFGLSASGLQTAFLVHNKLLLITTAGPWIKSFHSVSFCYNTDEKTIKQFQPGPLSVWSVPVLPMSPWVSSRYSGLLPHPKEGHIRRFPVSASSQSRWVWVWVWVALRWGGILSMWVPALCTELPGEALATQHLELE